MIFKALIFTIIHYLINKFFIKKKILLDKIETSKHKREVSFDKNVPLTGGLVFLIFLFFTPVLENQILLISLSLIYILGILSDLNILSSPSKRIFFQSLIIIILVLVGDLTIKTISIDFFDKLLEINFFNISFLLLCLLVLINGANFLDGLNTLVVIYFTICLSAIYFASYHYSLNLDQELIKDIIIILIIISFFNFFGKSFLGDSGSYCIAFFVGVTCINFIGENPQVVSPYFIASLLWYPAIENLFSIIRRTLMKKKLSSADNKHLHHLIYLSLKRKFYFYNLVFTNSFSAIIVNLYNFIVIFISISYISNSKALITIIFLNLMIYILAYNFFKKSFRFKK